MMRAASRVSVSNVSGIDGRRSQSSEQKSGMEAEEKRRESRGGWLIGVCAVVVVIGDSMLLVDGCQLKMLMLPAR